MMATRCKWVVSVAAGANRTALRAGGRATTLLGMTTYRRSRSILAVPLHFGSTCRDAAAAALISVRTAAIRTWGAGGTTRLHMWNVGAVGDAEARLAFQCGVCITRRRTCSYPDLPRFGRIRLP